MTDQTYGGEQWRSIAGYVGIYEVSSLGRIKRVVDSHQARSYAGRILKPNRQHTGYLTVSLYREKIPTVFLVHRLVAAAFIGPCPEGEQVNHIDADKTNNARWNLEYVTPLENDRHAVSLGLKPKGQEHGMAKLFDEDVIDIVGSLELGELQREVAARHEITQANVSYIWCGKTWSHVTGR